MSLRWTRRSTPARISITTPAAAGSRRIRFRPTRRAGTSTPSSHDENQRFLWGILEEAAKPTAGRSQVEAEDRRLFRRLHGRSRRREGRRRAARSRIWTRSPRCNRSARSARAAGAPASRDLRQPHAVRLRLQPGLRRFQPRDRLRRRRRAGAARSRLLHEDRRQIAGDARRSTWSTCSRCSSCWAKPPAARQGERRRP